MSHPARSIAGEMNFVQTSRSERAFLSKLSRLRLDYRGEQGRGFLYVRALAASALLTLPHGRQLESFPKFRRRLTAMPMRKTSGARLAANENASRVQP
jgi:hypothetical protein